MGARITTHVSGEIVIGADGRMGLRPFCKTRHKTMARIPYGYTLQGGSWVLEPEQAAAVARIFQEFGDPYRHTALSEIAAGLNVDQVATQRGGRWFASTVKYILRNECYAGAGGCPAIVNRALFDSVQARLQALPMGPAR